MAEDNGQSLEPEGDERPGWLPDNFDNPEAFAKSYKELQGRFTQETQARSALEENYADISSRLDELVATQSQPQQVDALTAAQQVADQFGVDPEVVNMAAYIAQETTKNLIAQQGQTLEQQSKVQLQAHYELVAAQADQALQSLYGQEWTPETRAKVTEKVQANPYLLPDEDMLSPQKTAQRLGEVFKQVKYDELVSGATQESGTTQPSVADLMARMKLNAQSATGASGRPDPIQDDKASWDAIAAAKPKNYYDS